MSQQGTLRAFIAIEVPTDITEALVEAERTLQTQCRAGVKWVPAQNMHLTLKFLGDVALTQLPEVIAAVEHEAMGAHPLHLAVASFGAFPNRSQPGVVWAGLAGDIEELSSLASRIDVRLHRMGFPLDTRPFAPHLTLGRVRQEVPVVDRRALGYAVAALSVAPGLEFRADSVNVMRSELRPEGAEYTRLSSSTFVE